MTLCKTAPLLCAIAILALSQGAAAQSPMSADDMAKALGLGGAASPAKPGRPKFRAPSFEVETANASEASILAAQKRSVSVIIEFDLGSARIRPDYLAQVREVDRLLRQFPTLHLAVVGHTDASGDARANQVLSERRAAAVRDLLAAGGVASSRLTSTGRGESEPLPATPLESPRNRRVEFVRTELP